MEITQLLVKVSSGDKEAYNSLYPLVYEKLRILAQKQLSREYSDHTLCKTELVHEAYEKMIDQSGVDFNDRAHFFAIAARSMRQILVDYARKKKTAKRGGEFSKIDIDIENLQTDEHADQILRLNETLNELKDLDERICTVVELRFFGGLSIDETADVLNISTSTVNRDWLKARGWLHQKLNQT
ncbi:MAG: sigma-70 family RNA polymerase sigma factor [Balneolaceae bacterium]